MQLAKHLGPKVTGVRSTTNLQIVQSLGADEVIDYSKEDLTQYGRTNDVILDAIGKSSFSRRKSSQKKDGIYIVTVPRPWALIQLPWTTVIGGKKVKLEGAPAKLENLLYLKELVETGKLKTVVDRRYPLEKMSEAYGYVEEEHKKGKVVITVPHDEEPSSRL